MNVDDDCEVANDSDIIRPDSSADVFISESSNNLNSNTETSKNVTIGEHNTSDISSMENDLPENVDDLKINDDKNKDLTTTSSSNVDTTNTTTESHSTNELVESVRVNDELSENDLETSILLDTNSTLINDNSENVNVQETSISGNIENNDKEPKTIEGIEELAKFKEDLLLICRHNLTNASALVRKASLLLMEFIAFTTIDMNPFLKSEVNIFIILYT